jgi:Cu+-exporting ATPase
MASSVFHVEGMTCSNCVDMVRSAVSAVDGVNNVKVDAESKQVTVDYDSNAANEQKIKDAITQMGYKVQ